jgi:hypothetical protein
LGVTCFSDNYFSELYFRTFVAVHSSPDVLNGITAIVLYSTGIGTTANSCQLLWARSLPHPCTPSHLLCWHTHIKNSIDGKFAHRHKARAASLLNQLWQPRSRIVTFTRLGLDLKMDLSEAMQGSIAHEIHQIHSSGPNSRQVFCSG